MRLSILRRIMEIEEGVIRRGRRPRWITPSEISIILHMIRKPIANSIIVLLFIQNSFKNKAKTCLPPLMLSSPSIVHGQDQCSTCSAPQIFSKQQMLPFELCSCHVFSYNYFAQFLLLQRVKCPPFFVLTTKRTQPRPQVFSVNGALTCKNAAFCM